MLLLFPLNVDVPMQRWPIMNWLLMAFTFCVFIWQQSHEEAALRFILGIEEADLGIKQHPLAIVMHMFLHLDIMHLLGNMVFMWVFGNAVCAKVGQVAYLILFLAVGVATGIIEPYGLGASGAINGVVGAYLVMYPLNDITCFYIFIVRGGTFSLASYWMILMWFGFDLLGLAGGGGHVAYLSHVSGLLIGSATMIALLKTGFIESDEYERSLLDIWAESRSGSGSTKSSGSKSSAPKRLATPLQPIVRLHVRLSNGVTKHLPVSEFERHESQGKPVNQFPVSEDGQTWTTFGEWRAKRT